MANAENKLKGNYYIAWLSRCDSAWRRLLADRGPYVPQHVLKKAHHAECQAIAKDMLRMQFKDRMQRKKLGLKTNPRRSAVMKRRRNYTPSRGAQLTLGQVRALEGMKKALARDDLGKADRYAEMALRLSRKRQSLGLNPRRRRRRNRSHAQRQARHYKLAHRRGRLGFLRRLKGKANPFSRSAMASYERMDPRKPFSAGWYSRYYPEQGVSEAERRRHNEKVLAELRRRRTKSNSRRRRR